MSSAATHCGLARLTTCCMANRSVMAGAPPTTRRCRCRLSEHRPGACTQDRVAPPGVSAVLDCPCSCLRMLPSKCEGSSMVPPPASCIENAVPGLVAGGAVRDGAVTQHPAFDNESQRPAAGRFAPRSLHPAPPMLAHAACSSPASIACLGFPSRLTRAVHTPSLRLQTSSMASATMDSGAAGEELGWGRPTPTLRPATQAVGGAMGASAGRGSCSRPCPHLSMCRKRLSREACRNH
jgi:hypothetical protein